MKNWSPASAVPEPGREKEQLRGSLFFQKLLHLDHFKGNLHHRVRVEGDRIDALPDQELGELRVVAGRLAAQAGMAPVPPGTLYRHGYEFHHTGIPFVEIVGNYHRIAVDPESQLGQVVRTDRETVEQPARIRRQGGCCSGSRTSRKPSGRFRPVQARSSPFRLAPFHLLQESGRTGS